MDRQDAKPNRPSLLAATANRSAPAPAPGRILADMENPRSRSRRVAPSRSRLPLLAVLLLVVAGAGALWRFNSQAPDAGEAVDYAAAAYADAPTEAAAVPATAVTTTDAPAAAMIVTDPPVPGAPVTQPVGARAASGAAETNPFAVTAAPRAAVLTASPPRPTASNSLKSSAKPVPPPVARSAAAKPTRTRAEADLLATLLGNIKHADRNEARSAPSGQAAPLATLQRPKRGSDPDALNALVRQVRERDSADSAGSALASSESVQAQMRNCPSATTNAGLRCRQKICNVAGQDRACPQIITSRIRRNQSR